MFFPLIAHVAFAADIPLAPFFGNPSEVIPAIKLSAGTYVGAEILVGPKERSLTASLRDSIVTLNGCNPMKLPIAAPFITGAGLTVTFESVFHAYNRREFPLVSAAWGSVYLKNNSFQSNSCRTRTQDEIALSGCSFDLITVGGSYPFISNPNVNDIILRDCTFRNIRWSGIKPSTPPLTQLVRTEVSNCSFYRCDGPLSGGIIPAIQATYTTVRNSAFDTCTNTVATSDDIPASTDTFTVTNSFFTNGSTTSLFPDGGALRFTRVINLTMTNVTFANHTSSGGGGVIAMTHGFERISCHQCRFMKNDAIKGGAFFFGRKEHPQSSGLTMSACSFANDARSGRDLYFESMGKNITQRNFWNCTSRTASPRIYNLETKRGHDWTNTPMA
ncbi:hypothetical protein BLNAU_7103 [Blattamonas nauphoetae]|uniref:Right handed beta helix domain-containing protein n=1 Tax=Blattamonas nauphoetae TaxID=2049346 RepID=A0ABQ9Y2F9_9EUKA|nr:hypothetical protein BLNAU_7103 [Blattamonas nauphoetae]